MSSVSADSTSTATVVTRFAPSPTGSLHLGNARTALFSYLLAQREGGRFILRIEDTDLARSADLYLDGLIEDLRWLGLEWGEGPGIGGPHAPYRQSERDGLYARFFSQLEERGLAYPCFCSALELEVSRKAQLAAGRPPRYAGTCRALSGADRQVRLARAGAEGGVKPTLRFRVPEGGQVRFVDTVRGVQEFAAGDIGDFIIRRGDGHAAFFFCNAVDDALMGVTHVLRGDDHLTNTPRQILLLEALGLDVPHYGHVALITGPDGSPLSKRHGSSSVQEFRVRGFLPEALNNHLFRLGHTSDREGWLSLEEMARHFQADHLGRAPARFDEAQLVHWQKEALAHADAKRVLAWLQAVMPAGLSEAEAGAFVELVRHNVVLPEDARPWVAVLFGDLPPLAEADAALVAQAGQGFFQAAVAAVEQHGANWQALTGAVKAATGCKGAALFKPLRVALTGRTDGPELAPLLKAMSADKARERLARFAG